MLNITIEWTGIVLSVLGILQSLIGTGVDRHIARYFVVFFSLLILFSLSNILGQQMHDLDHTEYILFVIIVFVNLCMPSVLAYVASRHLMSVIDPSNKMRAVRRTLIGLFGSQYHFSFNTAGVWGL